MDYIVLMEVVETFQELFHEAFDCGCCLTLAVPSCLSHKEVRSPTFAF